jgi:ABC-2 type transport system ATP-binding protein
MIELDGVAKHFGPVRAVNGITLSVPRGELFCFLGPNGAGKTTTIKMMCGLLKPTAGRIRIGGIDLAEDPVTPRRFTGYIPDSPFLYDRLTIAEFLEFTGDLYRVPRTVVERESREAFRRFGLEDYRATLIKDLSHGYRQRVVYAAAFLHQPEVLFVDEPFVGLDPHSIRLIHDLLRQKAAAGMTIFLTTHILAFAERLADRLGILAEGRLAALGTLEDLRRQSAVQGQLEDIFLSVTESVSSG